MNTAKNQTSFVLGRISAGGGGVVPSLLAVGDKPQRPSIQGTKCPQSAEALVKSTSA